MNFCAKIANRVWPWSVIRRQRVVIESMRIRDEHWEQKLDWYKYRDRLCSEMANTINCMSFEIAKLKGTHK